MRLTGLISLQSKGLSGDLAQSISSSFVLAFYLVLNSIVIITVTTTICSSHTCILKLIVGRCYREVEEEMATYSSILAWRLPVDRGAWQVTESDMT